MDMNFEIALFQPRIPQNTGNIGRLCVNTGSRLNLVKPLGFSLDEAYVRRAGLDYWPYLDLTLHECWMDFAAQKPRERLCFFSTKAERSLWDCPYPDGAILVFGNETDGLPADIHAEFPGQFYRIPMPGEHARSFNLANSVAIALFEGLRRRLAPGG